jgi:hypothetical protein
MRSEPVGRGVKKRSSWKLKRSLSANIFLIEHLTSGHLCV